MAAPHRTAAIRKAQVKVHPLRAKGALQGDDFQLPAQHGGSILARAHKGGLGEVAHHTQHEAACVVVKGHLFKAAAHIAAGFEVERHGTHGRPKSRLARR